MFPFPIPWKVVAIVGVIAAIIVALAMWKADIRRAVLIDIQNKQIRETLDIVKDKRDAEDSVNDKDDDSLRDLLGIPR